MRYSVIFYCYKCVHTVLYTQVRLKYAFDLGDSMAEWSAHQTCNVAVPGFSPALARPLIGFFLGYYKFKYSGISTQVASCRMG